MSLRSILRSEFTFWTILVVGSLIIYMVGAPLVGAYPLFSIIGRVLGTALLFFILHRFVWGNRDKILPMIPIAGRLFKWWYANHPIKKRGSKLWLTIKERGWAPLMVRLRRSRIQSIKNYLREHELKNPLLHNQLQHMFTQLRAEFMILMNIQTRLHTYFGKKGGVVDAQYRAAAMDKIFDQTPMTYDELSHVIDRHRFGQDEKSRLQGWNNNRLMIQKYFGMLKASLEDTGIREKYNEHEAKQRYDSTIINEFTGILKGMEQSYSQFQDDCRKFGLIHRLRSVKIHILDLVALYGGYKHYYRFANENAVFELWKIPDGAIDKGYKKRRGLGNALREEIPEVLRLVRWNPAGGDQIKVRVGDPTFWSVDFERLYNDKSYSGYKQYILAVNRKRHKLIKEKQYQFTQDLRDAYIREAYKDLQSERALAVNSQRHKLIKEKQYQFTQDLRDAYIREAHNHLIRKYPEITIETVKSNQDAMKLVEQKVGKEFDKRYRENNGYRKIYKRLVIDATEIELNRTMPPEITIETVKSNQDAMKLVEQKVGKEFGRRYREDKGYRELYKRQVIDATEIDLKNTRVRNEIKNEIARVSKEYRLGYVATTSDGPVRHEVDIKGFILEDIHAIEVEHKNPKYPGYIRRVRIEDIEDLPQMADSTLYSWGWVYQSILNEWESFISDLRWGQYHPNSRSDVDYMNIISKNTFDLISRPDNVIPRTPPLEGSRGAFDLEALRHSGKHVYIGKKNYWDVKPTDDPRFSNPYPALSTVGLSNVLAKLITQIEGVNDKTLKELSYWVWDTGSPDPEKVFSTAAVSGSENQNE